MKNRQIISFIERLRASSKRAKADFGVLTFEQLNWKPNPKSWSVGQCLDHIITTNELYFSIFQRELDGKSKRTFWERLPIMPNLWRSVLLPAVAPIPKRKVRTAPVFEPTKSDIPADIVEKFVAHNTNQLIPFYEQLDGIEIDNLVVTSPVSKIITYTLGTACRVLVDHEERHLYQANQVKQVKGFPTSK